MTNTHGIWTICVTYPFWALGVSSPPSAPPGCATEFEPSQFTPLACSEREPMVFFYLIKLIEYEQELPETLISSSEFMSKSSNITL